MKKSIALLTCLSVMFFFTTSSIANENIKAPFSDKELAMLNLMDDGKVDNIKAGDTSDDIVVWGLIIVCVVVALPFIMGYSEDKIEEDDARNN